MTMRSPPPPSLLLLLLLLLPLISSSAAFQTTKSILISAARTSFLVKVPATTIPYMAKNSEEDSSRLLRIIKRFDTLDAAGFNEPDQPPVLVARGGGFKRTVAFLVLGFAYKWYRARFINKIPVWDRQPQWNMVITSREQEKDLRAYTCLNCGSTLFIAKNREWFFEGSTGLAGLGCYTCGAKGMDNFVMDRDRIVEDVGDMDDYFDYERPLDFVSAAERRALLKKAKGNEDLANEMLLAQTKGNEGNVATAAEHSTAGTAATAETGELTKPKKKKKKKKKKNTDEQTGEAIEAKTEEAKPEIMETTTQARVEEAKPKILEMTEAQVEEPKTEKVAPKIETDEAKSFDDIADALGLDDI